MICLYRVTRIMGLGKSRYLNSFSCTKNTDSARKKSSHGVWSANRAPIWLTNPTEERNASIDQNLFSSKFMAMGRSVLRDKNQRPYVKFIYQNMLKKMFIENITDTVKWIKERTYCWYRDFPNRSIDGILVRDLSVYWIKWTVTYHYSKPRI